MLVVNLNKSENTCAVHDLVVEHMNYQIAQIEKGQQDMKDLMEKHHRETLEGIRQISDLQREEIKEINTKLDQELEKLRCEQRELQHSLQSLKMRIAYMTGGGIAAAAIISTIVSYSARLLPFLQNIM